jgi:hypothetical protein
MKKMTFLFIVSLPFSLFLTGYIAAYFFLQKSYVVVPNILGKSVYEGGLLLGQKGLFLAVLKEQEDPLGKDGTIVHQLPLPGQQSKFQKPVYVTVIKKSEILKAPAFFGLGIKDIEELARKTRLKASLVFLAAPYTSNVCFAQDPMPGQRVVNGVVTIYVAQGSRQLRMVPDVRGMIYEEAAALLTRAGVSFELFNVRDEGELLLPEHKIIDQRPRPGVFVDIDKALHLQIQVD